MEVDYYSKYLKYKTKYLELKKQMGGVCVGSFGEIGLGCGNKCTIYNCKCTEFDPKSNTDPDCKNCGHLCTAHGVDYDHKSTTGFLGLSDKKYYKVYHKIK